MKTKAPPVHGTNGHSSHGTAGKPNGDQPETVVKLPLDRLLISGLNTRPAPKRDSVIELAQSLAVRQTSPLVVRPHPTKPGCYEIGAGNRRRIAAEQPEAGPLETLDAVIRPLSDDEFEELILVDNLQRLDPDPREEAKLLERYVARGIRTAEEISTRIGKPKHWVLRRLQLLKVIKPLRESWDGKRGGRVVPISHFDVRMMELLGSLPENLQKSIAAEYGLQNCRDYAGLKQYLDRAVVCNLATAPFDLDDPRFFVKGCGPGCASDSSKQTGLFDFDGKKECGRCLNPECFTKRLAKFNAERVKELTEASGAESLPVVSTSYCSNKIRVGNETIEAKHSYEAKVGKAPEGAKPVIVLTDKGTLAAGYIPAQKNGDTGKKLASPKEKREERIHMLQGKRWSEVRVELLKALEKSTVKDCTADVVELVAIFGLPWAPLPDRDIIKGVSKHNHDLRNELWSVFDNRKDSGYPTDHAPHYDGSKRKPNAKTLKECLWEGLKARLKDQVGGTCGIAGTLDCVDDMRRVSALINFPIEERKREIDLKFPAPKSWGEVDPHTLQPAAPARKKK